ncbi:MAG: NAD(P)/FAD-dependent oxidoreductase, partial [Alphaproteobacteria bacterium]|nr:NAD(P)/FAD-dependent oxidoreductase [Alphaproteobacteria bacterium]
MSESPTAYDAIILGAGAAGMMCAAIAGQRGRKVLLVDHAGRAGKKILISGGGRCNFTNIDTRPECFLSQNPHFAKSALQRYRPSDFIALVDSYTIAWHEKTLGQLFCDRSARQIVDLLLSECAKGGVEIGLRCPVRDIAQADGRFRVAFEGRTASAPALVIATGGPAIPKMGATGFAYDVARRFRLEVVPPRPALVPLTLAEGEKDFGQLTGLATEVVARCGKAVFKEAALFTHKGLSGPAILQVSSYWSSGKPVDLDLFPDRRAGWLATLKRARPKASLASALAQVLPARLAQLLAQKIADHGDPAGVLGNFSDKSLTDIERRLSAWRFMPTGTEGFAKAEVTAGGVSTRDLSSQSMQANEVPGLYFIGEAVDDTGWLGGYNFQWAWASGWAC